jgi:hypothetical protein
MMVMVDSEAAVEFLDTAFEPDDWIAIFLKSYETGRTAQRVGPVTTFSQSRFHAWLRAMNAQRFNVYVSVNAIRPGVRSRTKAAIGAVRHLFLDADQDGAGVLARLAGREDIPRPSYILESSPNRVHVFWRVEGFSTQTIESLQRRLAAEVGTDSAATACSQTTRIPGYRNHKYDPAPLVTIAYRDDARRYVPCDLPTCPVPVQPVQLPRPLSRPRSVDVIERAGRYLAQVEPAIAGQHGDLHTFRVCCRIARGFALSDREAMSLLMEWNARCEPPWQERELLEKLRHARTYGREAIGALARR